MKIEPVVLEGSHVRLEPLSLSHTAGLWAAAGPEEIWRWMSFVIRSEDHVRNFIATAARMAEAGTALPFATIAMPAGEIAGSTGYWNIDKAHRRVEIGATWLAPKWQRSAVNTQAKYLMLRHAFEALGCIRVEFKTDSFNEKSRAAIKRLGAVEEGVLRNHMVQPDGRFRHSVCFSVIDSEWPEVKAGLEKRMASHA